MDASVTGVPVVEPVETRVVEAGYPVVEPVPRWLSLSKPSPVVEPVETPVVEPVETPDATLSAIAVEHEHAAHNYHPLPVVVSHGDGAWVTDVDGRRYLDCLAAYSAMNFGHGHPALLAAARAQLDRITLTSRAFFNDQFGPFVAALAALAGKDMVLPMNTGAEAVESGLKVARAWGYRVKGVPAARRTSSWRRGTSTAARFQLSVSPAIRSRTMISVRSRRGSGRCRMGMRARWRRRSMRTPWRCCWSRSRVRRG